MQQNLKSFIILFFISNFLFAQQNSIEFDNKIVRLIEEIDALPKTKVSGKGDFQYQTKFNLIWEKEKNLFKFVETRYKPNSNEKQSDKHLTEVDVKSLHPNGVLIRSIHENKYISLQLFTANNYNKIRGLSYDKGEYQFGILIDRITLGEWEDSVAVVKLDTIQKLMVEIIEYTTDWSDSLSPKMNQKANIEFIKDPGKEYRTISYDEKEESIFLNSTIDEPALFMNSKNIKENDDKVSSYLLNKLKEKGSELKGKFSGVLIISKNGEVESFKSFNMNKKSIEKQLNEIILQMPKWKPGKQKQNFVKSSYTVYINK